MKKTVDELTEKDKENRYLIKAKFLEKDEEIQSLKEQVIALTQSNKEIREWLKYPDKLREIALEKK